MKKNSWIWNGFVIILDRGHGVNTLGKRSPDSSFFEWEWNDMFIDKLKPELELLGYKVFDTVTEDTDPVLLKERTGQIRLLQNMELINASSYQYTVMLQETDNG